MGSETCAELYVPPSVAPVFTGAEELTVQHLNPKLWVFFPCTSNRPPNPSVSSIEDYLFAASRQGPGMATEAVLFFSYIGGHCQTRSITPSVMQTVPSSTSPNRLVQGEARPTQASLWSEPSRGPALFALLTSRELPLPGSRAASWADQGASALVLLWWLEKCGFCFLRGT